MPPETALGPAPIQIDANSLCGDGGWQSIDERNWERPGVESVAEAWKKEVSGFLDSMADEDVLVILDCHT